MAADDRYTPVDNAKLSLKHVSEHATDHIVFALITYAITLPALLMCMLPMPIVGPIVIMAHWLWYADNRDQLEAYATEQDIKLLGGPV